MGGFSIHFGHINRNYIIFRCSRSALVLDIRIGLWMDLTAFTSLFCVSTSDPFIMNSTDQFRFHIDWNFILSSVGTSAFNFYTEVHIICRVFPRSVYLWSSEHLFLESAWFWQDVVHPVCSSGSVRGIWFTLFIYLCNIRIFHCKYTLSAFMGSVN